MSDAHDRVLRTRLDSVKTLLRTVDELSNDVIHARSRVDDMRGQIAQLIRQINECKKAANALAAELSTKADNMGTYMSIQDDSYLVTSDDLHAIKMSANNLEDLLGQVQAAASNAYSAASGLRRWDSASNDGSIDATELKVSASALADELDATLQQDSPWAHYATSIVSRCDGLLGGYVDLLSGIALRDHGLDRDVSQFADDLVPTLVDAFRGNTTIALPTRHTAEWLIHTEHLRIPLPPGWTLWSLPLLARGVGELFRRKHGPDDALLSEVFATYLLGPAFAFAAILLELDPTGAPDGLDAKRAQVILGVLTHLDKSDDNGRFTSLARALQSEWEHAGADARDTQPAVLDDSATRPLIAAVEARCSAAAYLASDRWDRVGVIALQLVDDDYRPDIDAEFRDVLNAMWLARWLHPEKAATIVANANVVAQAMIAAKRGGPRPGRRMPTNRGSRP